MSAAPRTMRTVTMPTAPRFRRVSRLSAQQFAPFTLFMIATALLGVTSLCYVWQVGQSTTATMMYNANTIVLNNALNDTNALQQKIDHLKSPGVIMQAAKRYGMYMPNAAYVTYIYVRKPDVIKYVYVPASARPAPTSVRVAATSASVASWWQDAWVALYRLVG